MLDSTVAERPPPEAATARLHVFLAAAAALTREDLYTLNDQQFRDLAFAIQAKRADWDLAVILRPQIRRHRRSAFWPARGTAKWPEV